MAAFEQGKSHDRIKELSLRGGAADAAIQKVLRGLTQRYWIATPHARLAMTGQLISFLLQSPGIVVNYVKLNSSRAYYYAYEEQYNCGA